LIRTPMGFHIPRFLNPNRQLQCGTPLGFSVPVNDEAPCHYPQLCAVVHELFGFFVLVLVLSPQGGTRTRSGGDFEYHFIEYEYEYDRSMINVGNVKSVAPGRNKTRPLGLMTGLAPLSMSAAGAALSIAIRWNKVSCSDLRSTDRSEMKPVRRPLSCRMFPPCH
jgi:hypothetical protein